MWKLERQVATVAELHALGIAEEAEHPVRTVRVCEPIDTALVLGSAQLETDVIENPGMDVVRRNSGGGAVLVEPGGQVWIDLILPKHDPLWRDDVGVAFHWLGDVWKQVLIELGEVNVTMRDGGLIKNEWSRRVCFAGLGPGECLVDGKKVLGISQRRTREGALFQCSLLLKFDAARICHLVGVSDDGRRMLEESVTPVDLASVEVERALLAFLPE